MAVTARAIRILHRLRATVGRHADDMVRATTTRWLTAWTRVEPRWQAAADQIVATAAQSGRWPTPIRLARMAAVAAAVDATRTELDDLSTQTRDDTIAAAAAAIAATVDTEPRILGAQMPDTMAGEYADAAAARILPTAVDVIRQRVTQAITAQHRPLSADADAAMRRELLRGVRLGANPHDVARRMVAAVNGRFEGGLTRAAVIARTEILDAYREASRYAHTANIDVVGSWIWVCALDRRSCFPAGTLITTARGDVPIEHVRIGDEVLTHVGRWRRVYETLDQPYLGAMVTVKAGPLCVTATADHPFLVERQGELYWVEAQHIRCGDRVLSNRESIPHGVDHGFCEVAVERRGDKPDNGVPARLQEQGLLGVPVGDLGMPIGLVNLQRDVRGRQEKVDRPLPPGDGGFLDILDAEVLQGESNVAFGNGLSRVATVATDRAESCVAEAGQHAEVLATVHAVDHDGWSAAQLRAVVEALALFGGEDFAASPAWPVLSIGPSALDRTRDIAVSVATGHREDPVAAGAGLRDALGSIHARPRTVFARGRGTGLKVLFAPSTGNGDSGPSRLTAPSMRVLPLVGGVTLHPAKLPATLADPRGGHLVGLAAPRADSLLTGIASPLRTVGISANAGAVFTPGSSPIERGAASSTDRFHLHIVSSVRHHFQAPNVYNIEVEQDHSYLANGFVVHNCASCWSMHGREFPADQAGPWDHQQGRCARMPQVRPWRDLGIDLPEPDDAIPDAQTVFAGLPRAQQVQIMGPGRLAALDAGDVAWVDLAVLRDNPGWRPSYVPIPARDLTTAR